MSPETADLTELIERLRSAGFRVDTRQYLTAHELLFAYARRGKPLLDDPAALASHLGPIFCTQAEEQDRFAGEVAAWRGKLESQVPVPRDEAPFAVWFRWRRRLRIAALLAALFVGAGAMLAYEYRPVTLDGQVLTYQQGGLPVSAARVRFRDEPVAVDDHGRFKISTTRAAGFGALTAELAGYAPASLSVKADWRQPIELPLRMLQPGPPSTQALRIGAARAVSLDAPAPQVRAGGTPWNAIAWPSLLTAMVAFLLLVGMTVLRRRFARQQLEASAEIRRQLALRRLEHAGGVDEITLTPPPVSAVALNDFALRRVASAWRRPREQAIYELDAAATIDTTLRAGGLFAPVYAARRTSPEYVALVHRRSEDDHWARFVMEWLERLMASGVAVDVFTFHDDPRTCYDNEKRRRGYRLANLLAQHHRASVLLFAESRLCFAPAAESLEAWVHSFAALPRRVLFTPEVPYRWGYRESTLAAEGFVVLPGNAEGFRLFGEMTPDWRIERLFPAPYARAFPRMLADDPDRWLNRNQPSVDAIEKLVSQLRGYLGPDGFDWLCGCAVYPQIAWPLTLYLAGVADRADRRSPRRTSLLDTLPALGRLPWLRHGFMPDWLRRTLIAQMSSEQNEIVRRGIESLLEEIVLSATRVDAAKPKPPRGGVLSINRWIGPADLLGAAPPGSPLSDRVFLGFMSGTNVDPLSTSVTESLLGLFRRGVGSFDDAASTPASEAAPPKEPKPPIIVLSYRRGDSAPYAGRLGDRLRQTWPDIELVSDMDIAPGATWTQAAEDGNRRADVVLVMIGPKWKYRYAGYEANNASPQPDIAPGEVARALAQRKPVIPLLVGGARMPHESELPPDLAALARRNAMELRDDDWEEDVKRLIDNIGRLRPPPAIEEPRASSPQSAPSVAASQPIALRAREAAHAGRQAAREALARLRALGGFHPFTAAGAASVFVGLLAAAILWGSLPDELVPAAPDTGLSFAVFSANGQSLVVRDATGQAVLIEVIKRARATSTRKLGGAVQNVADQIAPATKVLRADGVKATAATFSTDSSTVIVGYADGTERRFEIPFGPQSSAMLPGQGRGAILALGTRANGAIIRVTPNGITSADPSGNAVSRTSRDLPGIVAASFDAEVGQAAITFSGGQVRIFDLRPATFGGERFGSETYGCGARTAPALSPNGNLLACADDEGSPLVSNLLSSGLGPLPKRLVSPTAAPASAPTSFAFSPDSRILAVVRATGEIEFWDIDSARVLASTRLVGAGPARAAAFNAKGDTFVAAGPVDVEILSVSLPDGATGGDIPGDIPSPAPVPNPNVDPTQAASDTVPSLLRLTVNAARISLDRHQLVVGNVQTRASSATKGTIVAQRPVAGSRALARTAVDVTVSDGSLVRVPNVAGLQVDAAEKTLAAARLAASRQEADSAAQPGVVIAQQPAAGTEVAASSGVRLTVARKPANPAAQQTIPPGNPSVPRNAPPTVAPDGTMVRVPNVAGLQVDVAEEKLAAAGLSASRLEADSAAQPGMVIAQQPLAGTAVTANSDVRLTVARRSANPTVQQGIRPQANPPSIAPRAQ